MEQQQPIPPQHHLAPDDVFEWESYVAPYKGRTKLQRLRYLAFHCPELRIPCSDALLDTYLQETTDVQGYHEALDLRNTQPPTLAETTAAAAAAAAATSTEPARLLPKQQRREPDAQWVEQTQRAVRSEAEKLDLELRNYQNNLIKESIRMAHRDLGDHFRACGQLRDALKCYARTRDFCSTSEHVMEMCLNAIGVLLELCEWQHIPTYVSKAEAVLDTYNPANVVAKTKSMSSYSLSCGGAGGSSVQPASKGGTTSGADAIGALFRAGGSAGVSSAGARTRGGAAGGGAQDGSRGGAGGGVASGRGGGGEVAEIATRLQVASALAQLGMGRYENCARTLLECDASKANALSSVVSPSDVAIYATLCSLATLPRGALRSAVLERTSFRGFLEHEPHCREALDEFGSCNYLGALRVLDKWKSRHVLDVYLGPHLERLRASILRRALQQFLEPFEAVTVSRVASAFGVRDEGDMARQLLAMVQRRDVDAKLDWKDKIVYSTRGGSTPASASSSSSAAAARREDFEAARRREAAFETALRVAERRTKAQRRLLLRVEMVQAGAVSRAAHFERVRD